MYLGLRLRVVCELSWSVQAIKVDCIIVAVEQDRTECAGQFLQSPMPTSSTTNAHLCYKEIYILTTRYSGTQDKMCTQPKTLWPHSADYKAELAQTAVYGLTIYRTKTISKSAFNWHSMTTNKTDQIQRVTTLVKPPTVATLKHHARFNHQQIFYPQKQKVSPNLGFNVWIVLVQSAANDWPVFACKLCQTSHVDCTIAVRV